MDIKFSVDQDADLVIISMQHQEILNQNQSCNNDATVEIATTADSIEITIKNASQFFNIDSLQNLQKSIKARTSRLKKSPKFTKYVQLDLENLLFSPTDQINAYPDEDVLRISPSIEQVKDLLQLLVTEPLGEDEIHEHLVENPGFIVNLACSGWNSPVAFFSKQRIGTFNFKIPDFMVVTVGQGYGFSLHLIEIERSTHSIFNQDLQFSPESRKAIKQVSDWQQYLSISNHQDSFRAELFKKIQNLAEDQQSILNLGEQQFSFIDRIALDKLLEDFQGHSRIHIEYLIVIGRWNRLSRKEKERLIFENQERGQNYKIITYDQMIKTAIGRPNNLPG